MRVIRNNKKSHAQMHNKYIYAREREARNKDERIARVVADNWTRASRVVVALFYS